MYRIAVVGYGNHASKTVIPAIVENQSLNLVAIVSNKRKKDIALGFKEFEVFTSLDCALSRCCLDIVYIATPLSCHYECIKKCLLAGVNVVCEKKMVLSAVETYELFELAFERKLVLREVYAYLYHSQFEKIIDCVSLIGVDNLRKVVVEFSIPDLDSNNIRYKSSLGGGALNDLAVYPISFLLALFNGKLTRRFSIVKNIAALEVDVSGLAVFEYKHVETICFWSFGSCYKNSAILTFNDCELIVGNCFSKPSSRSSDLIVIDSMYNKTDIKVSGENQFVKMLNYFILCVDEGVFEDSYAKLSLSCADMIDEIRLGY